MKYFIRWCKIGNHFIFKIGWAVTEKCDPNVTRCRRINAICGRPEVAGDVIFLSDMSRLSVAASS